jgi:GTPase SAR1 family protein
LLLNPITIVVDDYTTFGRTADILKKLLEGKLNIAIVGQVFTGKTWLLEQLMRDLKERNVEHVVSDFGSVTKHGEGMPEYVCLDHLPLLKTLATIKQTYPGIPLLAALYHKPVNGFHIVVDMRVDPRRLLLLACNH